MMNKINTFTDFIDVTEALQKRAIIDPTRTYARGGSAGGLLIGAVLNMAPALYHGVIAAVPFVDVITTMSDPSYHSRRGSGTMGRPKRKQVVLLTLRSGERTRLPELGHNGLA